MVREAITTTAISASCLAISAASTFFTYRPHRQPKNYASLAGDDFDGDGDVDIEADDQVDHRPATTSARAATYLTALGIACGALSSVLAGLLAFSKGVGAAIASILILSSWVR